MTLGLAGSDSDIDCIPRCGTNIERAISKLHTKTTGFRFEGSIGSYYRLVGVKVIIKFVIFFSTSGDCRTQMVNLTGYGKKIRNVNKLPKRPLREKSDGALVRTNNQGTVNSSNHSKLKIIRFITILSHINYKSYSYGNCNRF